ncbi:uncharacterized protein LOC143463361 [Clavelina lepadiformis]|uniref:uncharacterized protein LOC143463361 n=1 Tax=Clavelina lepadiformis TaxID=159417 RepID=UPI004042E7D3
MAKFLEFGFQTNQMTTMYPITTIAYVFQAAKYLGFQMGTNQTRKNKSNLCTSYVEGGANMIDIEAYINALKIKWIKLLIDPNNMEKIYRAHYNSTIETKLRSFQIKLNLKAIVSNQALFRFGALDSELCVFCRNTVESILHIFIQCSFSRIFWENEGI